eukprot:2651311-Rhodomonas_salina.1
MPTNGDLPPAPNGVPSEVLPLPPNNQSASAQATAPAPPVSGPAAGAGAPRGRSGVSDGLVTDIPPPRPMLFCHIAESELEVPNYFPCERDRTIRKIRNNFNCFLLVTGRSFGARNAFDSMCAHRIGNFSD